MFLLGSLRKWYIFTITQNNGNVTFNFELSFTFVESTIQYLLFDTITF